MKLLESVKVTLWGEEEEKGAKERHVFGLLPLLQTEQPHSHLLLRFYFVKSLLFLSLFLFFFKPVNYIEEIRQF